MGVTYLLDTHVVIWLAGRRRPPRTGLLDLLTEDDARSLASSVSVLEMATKLRIGKLPDARQLVDDWTPSLRELGAEELSLTSAHALAAGGLAWGHRDPFDRLLVGQAQVERLTLVTADRVMLAAPGIDVLPW